MVLTLDAIRISECDQMVYVLTKNTEYRFTFAGESVVGVARGIERKPGYLQEAQEVKLLGSWDWSTFDGNEDLIEVGKPFRFMTKGDVITTTVVKSISVEPSCG